MDINRKSIQLLFYILLFFSFAIAVGWSVSNGAYSVLILISLIFLILVLLSLDSKLAGKPKHTPIMLIVWILIQPLLRIFEIHYAIQLGVQFGSIFLFLYYFLLKDSEKRWAIWNMCKPLLVLGLIFWGVLGISFLSQPFTRTDFVFLGEIMASFLFAFLPCVVCENMDDVVRLMKTLVFVGLIQFPIVLAQGIGFADKLPPVFSQLYTLNWGGSITSTTQLVRYPGSFGDVELLAEFAGLVFIISIGLALIKPRERLFWVIVTTILFVIGWLTGTRAFLVVVSGGLIVLLISLLYNSQIKINQILRYLIGSIPIFFIAFYFIPNNIINGLLGRFKGLQFNGVDAFNRAYLYNSAFSLLPKMPFFGYGGLMWSVFRQAANYYYADPHSFYIWMLLYAGYPGLLTSVLLMLVLIIWTFWLSRQVSYKLIGQLGSVLLAATAYLIVNETKIVFLRSYFYADLIFFFFGLVAVTYGLGRRIKIQQVTTKNKAFK